MKYVKIKTVNYVDINSRCVEIACTMNKLLLFLYIGGCPDRMIVGFTTYYGISSNPAHGDVHSIQYYVIKFVSDL